LKAKKTIFKSRYGMCLSIFLFLSELWCVPTWRYTALEGVGECNLECTRSHHGWMVGTITTWHLTCRMKQCALALQFCSVKFEITRKAGRCYGSGDLLNMSKVSTSCCSLLPSGERCHYVPAKCNFFLQVRH
jgi:hypothetical protein